MIEECLKRVVGDRISQKPIHAGGFREYGAHVNNVGHHVSCRTIRLNPSKPSGAQEGVFI